MATITSTTNAIFSEKLVQARRQKGLTKGQIVKGLLDAFIKKSKLEMLAHS